MDMVYETGDLNPIQATEFLCRFDLEIGTEREENRSHEHEQAYYITCFELTRKEVTACRQLEQDVRKI